MPAPTRITIALDTETAKLFENLKEGESASKSGLIRRALKFYANYKDMLEGEDERVRMYMDMLAEGEHIILDLDHWILFLKMLEASPAADEYWEVHKRIAGSHAEQLGERVRSVEDILNRLAACNFFKVSKSSEKDFTLVLASELSKEWISTFLEEYLQGIGQKIEIKEDYSKLRLKIL
jgi:hypothetical protein